MAKIGLDSTRVTYLSTLLLLQSTCMSLFTYRRKLRVMTFVVGRLFSCSVGCARLSANVFDFALVFLQIQTKSPSHSIGLIKIVKKVQLNWSDDQRISKMHAVLLSQFNALFIGFKLFCCNFIQIWKVMGSPLSFISTRWMVAAKHVPRRQYTYWRTACLGDCFYLQLSNLYSCRMYLFDEWMRTGGGGRQWSLFIVRENIISFIYCGLTAMNVHLEQTLTNLLGSPINYCLHLLLLGGTNTMTRREL